MSETQNSPQSTKKDLSQKKPRALIICPGRGSYTQNSLGYFRRYETIWKQEKISQIIKECDAYRAEKERSLVSALDGAFTFLPETYFRGENGAALTFTASVADFRAIEDSIEPVAILGNSMGWYTALHLGGVLDLKDAFSLVDEMGNMQSLGQGSQLLYPQVDEDWRFSPQRATQITEALHEAKGLGAWVSIQLGGYVVLAGTQEALDRLAEKLPVLPGKGGAPTYPLKLPYHAAFHSPLMQEVAKEAKKRLSYLSFQEPTCSLIDGQGMIYRPRWGDPQTLFSYTLEKQVVDTYDFSLALRVALREFVPDVLVLLGPGESLGGAVAQILIQEGFFDLRKKSEFIERQKKDPIVLASARPTIFTALSQQN